MVTVCRTKQAVLTHWSKFRGEQSLEQFAALINNVSACEQRCRCDNKSQFSVNYSTSLREKLAKGLQCKSYVRPEKEHLPQ